VKWFYKYADRIMGKKEVDGERNETLRLFNVYPHMGGTYTCYCKREPKTLSYMANSVLRINSKELSLS